MKTFSIYMAALACAALAACSGPSESTPDDMVPTNTAAVFVNADIITMNDAAPSAEALAVKDGVIIAVGQRADVEAAAGVGAGVREMSGKTILPGLIDAHGHFMVSTQTAGMADLQPPPAGGVSTMDELKAVLTAWEQANPDAPWIVGFGYDDSLLAENRHPSKEDLDAVSTDRPIMLLHVSAHFISCNSACLDVAGIDASTANPAGGVIRRMADSNEPDGVLEETAMQLVLAKLPPPTPQQVMEGLRTTQALYASKGITTAQEGAASPQALAGLAQLAAAGQLKLDVVAFKAIRRVEDFDADFAVSDTYENHFRTGGLKLILDGSPQGKTAWLTHPYHITPAGTPDDYSGYPIMQTADVNAIVSDAFKRGVPVIAHANGDAASDQLLDAVALANADQGAKDRRTVMIHAQTVRDDQVARMKAEGVVPSYFVAHTFFWGDWHRDSVLGPERAARISPLKSSVDIGLTFTIHNDTPVVPPDMMRLVWAAVNRETRSGQVLGPDERVSPMDALRAITLDAAYQYFEEDRKGSIEVGKLADLTVLAENPLTVPAAAIADIRVLETIKEGKTIFAAE